MSISRPTTVRITAALGFLMWTVASAGSAQEIFETRGEQFSFGGVGFPSVVDTFAAMQTSRYSQRSLGTLLNYSTPLDRSARLDVYVYPVQSGPDAETGDVVQAEFDLALQGMFEFARRNPRALVIHDEEHEPVTVVDRAGVSWEGWRAEANLRERGLDQKSFLYVFIKEGSYVKYRISYASDLDETMRPRAETFVAETLDLVTVPEK